MSTYEPTRVPEQVGESPWPGAGEGSDVVDDIAMIEGVTTTENVPAPLPPALPYGSWPSPITAADVAGGQRLISYPRGIGQDVWWQERLPAEGGRTTVVHLGADSQQRFLLPQPWNARTRV